MKTGKLLFIDKYLGFPLAILLNVFVRLVGKILRPDHSLSKEFKRFAVVKYKGLGSIVQATGLIRTLKLNYPDSQIYFITSIQNRGIVEKIPDISKGLYFDDQNLTRIMIGLPGFILKLIRLKLQVLFDLEVYSNISSVLSTISLATNRFGYYRSSSQYRMGLYSHMIYFNTSVPLSQCYLQMARNLPIKTEEKKPIQFIVRDSFSMLDFLHSSGPFILINPNASDLRIERRWPPQLFGKLIDKIFEEYRDYQVVLIGNNSEREHVQKVIKEISIKSELLVDLSGKTNLDQLIWLVSNARLFITGDTGPAHLAYAQETNAIVLFGPVNPDQFQIPANVKSIYKNLYCSPCVHEFNIPPCYGDNQCMKMISVEEVMREVDYFLGREKEFINSEKEINYRDNDGKTLGRLMRKRK